MSQRDAQNVNNPASTSQGYMETPGQTGQGNNVQGLESSGKSHRMSIALTIGATIGLIGLVLLLYGLFGNAQFSRSDGINIDLWWGLVMLVFGTLMAIGGYLAARRQAAR